MSYSDSPRLRGSGYSLANQQAPSVTAGAAAGTGATATVAGGDERGVVTVTAAGTPADTGVLVTLTFATPYTIAPDAVVIQQNDANPALTFYVSAVTTAHFVVTMKGSVAPTAADVYKLHYLVIGGA